KNADSYPGNELVDNHCTAAALKTCHRISFTELIKKRRDRGKLALPRIRGWTTTRSGGVRTFMVRKMNHRFKNILTVDVIVGSVMVAGGCGTYNDKIRLSVSF